MITSKVSEKGSLVRIKEPILGTMYRSSSEGDGFYDLCMIDLQPGQMFLLLKESNNESVVLVPGCGQVHFSTYIDNLPNEAAEAIILPVYEHVQI
jgi:hypothetical protein